MTRPCRADLTFALNVLSVLVIAAAALYFGGVSAYDRRRLHRELDGLTRKIDHLQQEAGRCPCLVHPMLHTPTPLPRTTTPP